MIETAYVSEHVSEHNKLCAWRHVPPPLSSLPWAPKRLARRRADATLSHAEYVPMLTAAATLRVKAALSKSAW